MIEEDIERGRRLDFGRTGSVSLNDLLCVSLDMSKIERDFQREEMESRNAKLVESIIEHEKLMQEMRTEVHKSYEMIATLELNVKQFEGRCEVEAQKNKRLEQENSELKLQLQTTGNKKIYDCSILCKTNAVLQVQLLVQESKLKTTEIKLRTASQEVLKWKIENETLQENNTTLQVMLNEYKKMNDKKFDRTSWLCDQTASLLETTPALAAVNDELLAPSDSERLFLERTPSNKRAREEERSFTLPKRQCSKSSTYNSTWIKGSNSSSLKSIETSLDESEIQERNETSSERSEDESVIIDPSFFNKSELSIQTASDFITQRDGKQVPDFFRNKVSSLKTGNETSGESNAETENQREAVECCVGDLVVSVIESIEMNQSSLIDDDVFIPPEHVLQHYPEALTADTKLKEEEEIEEAKEAETTKTALVKNPAFGLKRVTTGVAMRPPSKPAVLRKPLAPVQNTARATKSGYASLRGRGAGKL